MRRLPYVLFSDSSAISQAEEAVWVAEIAASLEAGDRANCKVNNFGAIADYVARAQEFIAAAVSAVKARHAGEFKIEKAGGA